MVSGWTKSRPKKRILGDKLGGRSLPVTMSRPWYMWRESAERRLTDSDGVRLPQHFVLRNDKFLDSGSSPEWRWSNVSATWRANEVLPEAVGPQMTRIFFILYCTFHITIREIPPLRSEWHAGLDCRVDHAPRNDGCTRGRWDGTWDCPC